MLSESPPIVSGVSDMHPSVSKRGRDTESDAVIRLEEIHTFFSNECFLCSSTRNLHHVLLLVSSKKQKKINFFYQWGTFSKIPHVTSL